MPVTACNLDKVFACDFPHPGQTQIEGNCLQNFTIPGAAKIVLRADQVAGLGVSTALTIGATETLPVSGCATATVTAGLRFSTISVAVRHL